MLHKVSVSESVRVVPGRYGSIAYWVNDFVIGRTVEAYGEWFESEVDVFRLYCKPGDTVLDIGSNIGTHTQALASIVGPRGRVVAVEPQKPMYMLTCANAVMNNYLNVDAYRMAVGAKRDVMQCTVPDYSRPASFGGWSLDTAFDERHVKEFIQIVPIDDLVGVDEKVSFIKIDVEGSEANAVAGATRVINRSRPVLYVENDRIAKSPALIRSLLKLNYHLYWHTPLAYNKDNYAGNPNIIHDVGKFWAQGQFWMIGKSVNLLCLPTMDLPLPDDVTTVVGIDSHPCKEG